MHQKKKTSFKNSLISFCSGARERIFPIRCRRRRRRQCEIQCNIFNNIYHCLLLLLLLLLLFHPFPSRYGISFSSVFLNNNKNNEIFNIIMQQQQHGGAAYLHIDIIHRPRLYLGTYRYIKRNRVVFILFFFYLLYMLL